MSEAEHKPSDRSFVATVIIVIGIAWMSLTGFCTAFFTVTGLFGGGGVSELLTGLPIIALVGAICTLPGFLIWLLGRWLRNRRKRAAQSDARER
jgi:hypothetical protein